MSEQGGYTQAFADIMNSRLAQDIMNAYNQGVKVERTRTLAILRKAVTASEDLAGVAFPAKMNTIIEEIEAPNEH